VNEIQKQLTNVYKQFRAQSGSLTPCAGKLSPPLLISVPDKWQESKPRILIVGQETAGWGGRSGYGYPWPWEPVTNFAQFLAVPNSVEALLELYKQFEFARYDPKNYASPFWKAYRKIRGAIDGTTEGFETSVLWTNLWRMDYEGGPVHTHGDVKMDVWNAQNNIFVKELSILRADGVIFFVGPNNKWFLEDAFPRLELREFAGHGKWLRWLRHADLPPHSIFTYHPAYLARVKRTDVIDTLVREFVPLLRSTTKD
jgi:hypothetical protein